MTKVWKPTKKKSFHTTLTPQAQMDLHNFGALMGMGYHNDAIALALHIALWVATEMPAVFELIEEGDDE